MAKFCGKCGSKLDDITGLCPLCSGGLNASTPHNTIPSYAEKEPLTRKEKKRKKKQERIVAMTFGQKAKRFFMRICIWLVIWIILCLVIAGGLVYLDIVDIPVVEDIVHEIEIILHNEHEWLDATCVAPKMCEICDETEGEPLGHSWISATCDSPEICSVCGEIGSPATGHDWTVATCTDPKTCLVCKKTDGSAAGHMWAEATYEAPKTCEVCGETDGDPLTPEPIYLIDMDFSDKYGKVYYHDNEKANYDNNSDWRDLYTPGHVQRLVCDGYGNTFTYGIHMDGDQLGPYYITYDLESKYTQFSGWCVLPDYKVGTSDAKTYSKYFEIYCDGKLVFTSNTMRNGSSSQYFEIDVTDVDVLTIQYAPTTGPNDLAVLCDGLLS